MTKSKNKWLKYYLFLTLSVSSFVIIEPAFYDLLMVLIILVGFLFSFYRFTRDLIFPLVVVCIFLISNLLSLLLQNEIGASILFSGITLYLALTWIGLIGMGIKPPTLQFIVNGYLFSACFAALIGIFAYFDLLPSSEQYLMYDRAKAFFKDPNVFGPFLVMPALFAISRTEILEISVAKKIFYFFIFILLTTGIIISFSRAAWGNYAISLSIYLIVFKKADLRKRFKTLFILLLVGFPVLIYFTQIPLVENLLASRLSYQNYDESRFDTQKAAFLAGLFHPFGIGPGQSDIIFRYSPHSLYMRLFSENGVVGLFSFVLFVLISLRRSFQSYWFTKNNNSVLFLIIFASLVGLAFNSFFVDTLHWRHFWLILAFAWVPAIEQKEKRKGSLY